MTTKNDRTNPFTGAVATNTGRIDSVSVEEHTDKSLFGFYLTEWVVNQNVTIADITSGAATGAIANVVYNNTTTPPVGTINIDTLSKTGFCQANPSDDGLVLEVTYDGGGFAAHETNIEDIGGGGAGGGVTGIDYVKSGDAEDAVVTDWNDAASGFMTVTFTEATGEVLRGTKSFLITSTTGVTADTDYVTADLNAFDLADTNKDIRVSFDAIGLTDYDAEDLKVILRDTTNNTDLIVNPLVSGGQGPFEGIVATSNSQTYELRFVANVSTPFEIAIDNVQVGPGDTVFSAGISNWQDFTLTVDAVTTAPTKEVTNLVVDNAQFRRVGDSMEITWTYVHGTVTEGAAGSGTYLFKIPTGYTIDSTKIDVSTTDMRGICGSLTGLVGTNYDGTISTYDTTSLQANIGNDLTAHTLISSGFFGFDNSDLTISLRAIVPIAEWDTGVVTNLSRIEYQSNSDTTNADDLVSFKAGEAGNLVPVVATTNKKKRVRFSKNFKHTFVEVNINGDGWVPLSDSYISYHVNVSGFGIYMKNVSGVDTDRDVFFVQAGTKEDATAAQTWTQENSNGTLWRVVGTDNPLPVQAGQRKTLSATSSTKSTLFPALYYLMTGNSVDLTPGIWQLKGALQISDGGALSGLASTRVGWYTVNGNDTGSEPTPLTVDAGFYQSRIQNASTNAVGLPAQEVEISISSGTTVYLVPFASFSSGTADIVTHIYARQIA